MDNSFNKVSIEEAISIVKSGDRIFVQGAAMTPNTLVNALCENRYKELENVEVISIHTDGEVKYAIPPYNQAFKINSCFVGGNVRKAVNTNQGDYIPIFLSEIGLLFRRNILPLDVAIVQVSSPDRHGFCSLGVSVDVTLAAIQTAKKVIAQVNPHVPRTHGDGIIHVRNIDYAIDVNDPIHTYNPTELSENDKRIGKMLQNLLRMVLLYN